MKERYIVLVSAPETEATTVFLGSPKATKSARRSSPALQLHVDELEPAAAARLSRDRVARTIAAPAMPMRLIRPVRPKKKPPGKKKPAGKKQPVSNWGIGAVGADTSPFTGKGIVVAVLDTGIDAKHPAFKGVTLVRKNYTQDPDGDTDGHGTHCAGTIFGRDVDGVRIGIARGVKKALIGKVLGDDGADTEIVAQAIYWAVTEGAHVVSMSLGFDFPGYQREMTDLGLPAELATSRALDGYRRNVLMFEHLARSTQSLADVTGGASVIIAAAGNESQTDENPDFKIAVSPPAVANGIISVGALGDSPDGLYVAPFSNTGALIAGPGVDIISALAGGGLHTDSGTSMAAPHVAGVAALWAEKLSTGALTTVQLTNRLLGGASMTRIKADVAPEDIGGGMVTAPQS